MARPCPAAPTYQHRQPEQTVLYRTIAALSRSETSSALASPWIGARGNAWARVGPRLTVSRIAFEDEPANVDRRPTGRRAGGRDPAGSAGEAVRKVQMGRVDGVLTGTGLVPLRCDHRPPRSCSRRALLSGRHHVDQRHPSALGALSLLRPAGVQNGTRSSARTAVWCVREAWQRLSAQPTPVTSHLEPPDSKRHLPRGRNRRVA